MWYILYVKNSGINISLSAERQNSKMKKICYIFGAVKTDNIFIDSTADRFIIAADAGLSILQKEGITPDLIVGDFDSLGKLPNTSVEIIRHPIEKDDTDMLLAIKEGLRRGYDTFIIYGGLGRRLDHTLANLQSLSYLAEHSARGYLLGENTVATVIKNDFIEFDSSLFGTVSVFATGGNAKGVSENGLKYSLCDADLSPSFPIGVSNEFQNKPAKISVSQGLLTVIWNEEPKSLVERIS